jgi:NAD(P)-dependent dehydrogenase (short-subunit alcohol dehydrogenase family)
MLSPQFAGSSVLITGAGRGIGLGVAEAFAAAGAELHLLDQDPSVRTEAARLGAQAYVADITDAPAVAAALAQAGPLNVLINNAGLERLTPVDACDDATLQVFRRVVETNVIGTDLVTRHALRRMSAGGCIINTASIWGRVAEPLFGAYVASKHAVIGLTKTWARELGGRGIRVNAVCPGWVRTPSAMASLSRMAKRASRSENDLLAAILAGQALDGLMEPADVAGPYLYLASDLAANITGQTLGIDRGEVPW